MCLHEITQPTDHTARCKVDAIALYHRPPEYREKWPEVILFRKTMNPLLSLNLFDFEINIP